MVNSETYRNFFFSRLPNENKMRVLCETSEEAEELRKLATLSFETLHSEYLSTETNSRSRYFFWDTDMGYAEYPVGFNAYQIGNENTLTILEFMGRIFTESCLMSLEDNATYDGLEELL